MADHRPFAPDMSHPTACQPQATMWDAATQRQLAYKTGAVLNTGFSGGPVSMEAVEAGGVPPPNDASPYLVAYARLIGLQAGDVVEFALVGPDGVNLAKAATPPLDHDKAQYVNYVGKKRPATGWPRGIYKAALDVRRAGTVVITQRFQTRF